MKSLAKTLAVAFMFASSSAFAQSCEQIDQALAAAYTEMSNHSHYYSNEPDSKKQFDSATAAFNEAIAAYTIMEDSLACPLKLADKAGVNIQTSDDGKFRTISWDELNGGTMHHFDGLIQYQGKQTSHILTKAINGQVWELHTLTLPTDDGGERTVYMVIDHGIYSTLVHSESLTLYAIEDEKLIYPNIIQTSSRKTNTLGFGYSTNSPNGPEKMPFIKVDAKQKLITLPVVIESKAYPYGELTNRQIKYRFIDGYFKKVTR